MEHYCSHRKLFWLGIVCLGIVLCGVHVYDQLSEDVNLHNLYYLHRDDVRPVALPDNKALRSEATLTDQSNSPFYIPPESTQRKNKTKVLLLTYMRGGSTLLGEMLNQNPEATLWFEPIDGVYSELYGTIHGWFPLDLMTQDQGTPRVIPDFEQRAILKQFTNLMMCNIDAMTTDTLGHYAMTHITQKRFGEYVQCLLDTNRVQPIAPWYCKGRIKNICPRYFSSNETLINTCHYCLHVAEKSHFYANDSNREQWAPVERVFDKRCDVARAPFDSYSQCMINYRSQMEHCLPKVKSVCDNSTIIGAKSIRLRADIVFNLMKDHPDLNVVYQVRDPRGIVYSRRSTGLLSRLSGRNVTRESRALCERIKYDMEYVKQMQREFPARLLRVRYEDLVLDPLTATKDFYGLLGRKVPDDVTIALQNSIHSKVQGTAYNTIRKNGTASIDKWRKGLNTEDQAYMATVCLDVLRYFEYPLT